MITEKNAIGTKVLKDGFEGMIVAIYDWPMVEVRLNSGLCCVDVSDLNKQKLIVRLKEKKLDITFGFLYLILNIRFFEGNIKCKQTK